MTKQLTVEPGVSKFVPEYIDDGDNDPPICIRVSTVEAFSESSPAEIEISIRNCHDSDITIASGYGYPFTELGGHNNNDELLLLLPTGDIGGRFDDENVTDHFDWDRFRPESPIDGIWKLRESMTTVDVGVSLRLAPGENVRNSYQVLAGSDASTFPTGEFRFNENYAVGLGDEILVGRHYATVETELSVSVLPE